MDDLNSFFRRQPLIRGYPECILRDAQEERCLRVAEAQHTSEDDVTRLHALVELNLNRELWLLVSTKRTRLVLLRRPNILSAEGRIELVVQQRVLDAHNGTLGKLQRNRFYLKCGTCTTRTQFGISAAVST